MLIETGNVHSRVVRATPEERKWLDSILSFRDKSFKARMRGGRTHLYNDITGTFPAGLTSSVVKRAKKSSRRVDLLDTRKVPVRAAPDALTDWLRAHQVEGLNVARRVPRGIFHHVTGAGKTELIISLAELYPCRWLIFVHKKDLLLQIKKRFARRTGERIGIWGDGGRDLSCRVTVAMFQSVHNALKSRDVKARMFLQQVQGIAIDECHVTPAGTFWTCVQACQSAYYRYGFSGTPLARSDQKSMYAIAAIGPVIHRVSAEQLWDIGWIAKPRITLTPVKHTASAARTWDAVYKEKIIHSPSRNRAVVERAIQAHKPTLLFVKAKDHGKILERDLRKRGQRVEFVWGDKATPMRTAAIDRLVHGDIDILISSVIFQEGIDIPALRSVGIASGGKSAIMVLQNTGRGTRRHNERGEVVKDEFEVYDFQDLGCGCRGIHPSCKWLEKHTQERLAAYAMEKYPVYIKKGDAAWDTQSRKKSSAASSRAFTTVSPPL